MAAQTARLMPPGTQTANRLPGLDGIRAIAILVVCIFHFHFVFIPAAGRLERLLFDGLYFGWAGVDLFFALSGFLITGILLDSRDRAHHFRTFYLRRALRIFPLYFAFLATVLIIERVLMPGHWPYLDWRWYVAYVQNWKGTAHDPLVSHLWSLSIEEQFYLVWPFVVFVLPRRYSLLVCFCLAGAAFLLRILLLQSGHGSAIYQGTFTRMDGLVLGSAAAIAFRDRAALKTWLRFSKPAIFLCCCALTAVVIHQRSFDFLLDMTIWGESLLAILFSLVILRTAVNPPQALCSAPLARIAKCAYGMYVFHEFANRLIGPHFAEAVSGIPEIPRIALKLLFIAAMTLLTYVAARISWKYFEEPFLRLKDRRPERIQLGRAYPKPAITSPGGYHETK